MNRLINDALIFQFYGISTPLSFPLKLNQLKIGAKVQLAVKYQNKLL